MRELIAPCVEVGLMFSLGASVVPSSPQPSKVGSLCSAFIILGECTHIFQEAWLRNFGGDAKFPPSLRADLHFSPFPDLQFV